MGAQKKAHKRMDRKQSPGLPIDKKYIILAVIAAGISAAVLGILSLNKSPGPTIEVPQDSNHYAFESYSSSVPDPVQTADHIPKHIRDAIRPYTEPELHPIKNIRGLPSNLKDWPPGERGLGITLDEKKLSAEENEKRESMYKKHAFQEYVSDLISPNRSLPDWRGDWCQKTYSEDRPDLDSTSVVVCFHNEAWSTLIRTVHSVVNRSPDHLLEEILLIDDASTMDHLGEGGHFHVVLRLSYSNDEPISI